jgi:hypothetical protein
MDLAMFECVDATRRDELDRLESNLQRLLNGRVRELRVLAGP